MLRPTTGPIDNDKSTDNLWMYEQITVMTDIWMPVQYIDDLTDIPGDIQMDIQPYQCTDEHTDGLQTYQQMNRHTNRYTDMPNNLQCEPSDIYLSLHLCT